MNTKTANKNFYTLNELARLDTQELYVLNTSKPKGNIAFVVSDGLGGKISVLISATWIPVDLTTKATRDVLIKSPDLRRLFTAGFVAFPTIEYVEQILQQEGAQQEVGRVYNAIENHDNNIGVVNKESQAVLKGSDVSGFVLTICNAEDIDEGEALNSARQQADTMTKEDLNYLMNNCKFPKVKSFAAAQLANMNN